MDVSDAPPDVDPDNIAELSAIPDVWYTANKPAALVKKHKAVGRARREALECGVEGTKKKKKGVGAPQASNREDTEDTVMCVTVANVRRPGLVSE